MRPLNHNEYEPISEINVTPFVDVLLVLLVIFMISAPLLTKAIPVQLPQENLRSSTMTNNRKLVITVDHKGRPSIDNRRYKLEEIKKIALSWREQNRGKPVFIQADHRANYGKVTTLLVLLKNAGIQDVGLLIKEKS